MIEDLNKKIEWLLTKWETQSFSYDDANILLNSYIDDWEFFFNQIESHFSKKQNRILKIYTPGKIFPSISVTGTVCALSCIHCNKHYLSHMLQASTSKNFSAILQNLLRNKCKGALLSGGCTSEGIVPILKYAPIISDFKQNHPNFFFNAHVGLINESDAKEIKKIGIDTVSFDFIVDSKIISDIFHLKATPEDYIYVYRNLINAGIRVVPHILIGGHFGQINKELDVLYKLKEFNPNLIVFLIMIPPIRPENSINLPTDNKNQFHILKAEFVGLICLVARLFFPMAELSLGCMRPREINNIHLEKFVIQAGIDRIELPSRKTLDWVKMNNYSLSYFNACCAIPREFEEHVISKDPRR